MTKDSSTTQSSVEILNISNAQITFTWFSRKIIEIDSTYSRPTQQWIALMGCKRDNGESEGFHKRDKVEDKVEDEEDREQRWNLHSLIVPLRATLQSRREWSIKEYKFHIFPQDQRHSTYPCWHVVGFWCPVENICLGATQMWNIFKYALSTCVRYHKRVSMCESSFNSIVVFPVLLPVVIV